MPSPHSTPEPATLPIFPKWPKTEKFYFRPPTSAHGLIKTHRHKGLGPPRWGSFSWLHVPQGGLCALPWAVIGPPFQGFCGRFLDSLRLCLFTTLLSSFLFGPSPRKQLLEGRRFFNSKITRSRKSLTPFFLTAGFLTIGPTYGRSERPCASCHLRERAQAQCGGPFR